MSEESTVNIRLSKASKEFNVGRETIVEFLTKKGFQVDPSPNTKLTSEMYALLVKEYQGERDVKNEAKKLGDLSYKGGSVSVDSAVQSSVNNKEEEEAEEVFIRTSTISPQTMVEKVEKPAPAEVVEEKKEEKKEAPKQEETPDSDSPLKVVGKIDLDSINPKTRPDKKSKEERQREAKEKAEREKVEAEKRKAEAKKAQEAGITTVVFDRNGYLYHGRVKEVADAARNGGLKF